MTAFVTLIIFILAVIAGGYMLGSAVADFKAERYVAFGVDVMVTIAMVLWMIGRLLYVYS